MAAAAAVRRPAAVRFVALDRQHSAYESELQDAFMRLLGSSAFTLGAEVERFEAEFADYCDAAHCVGVVSGTAALTLVLRRHGIGPGDEVIVPGHTFIASALAVLHAGATPVLLRRRRGHRPDRPRRGASRGRAAHAAIIAVHLYGQACDMDAIHERRQAATGCCVLEDAAQAHGARYRGRAGRLARRRRPRSRSTRPRTSARSATAARSAPTTTELAARLRRLRNLGQRAKGEHVELGYNERLDGLQAALLRVKLQYLDEWNDARRSHAARYATAAPGRCPAARRSAPTARASSTCFPARFDDRDAMARVLRATASDRRCTTSPAIHGHSAWDGTRSATASCRCRRRGPPRSCRCRCTPTCAARRDRAGRGGGRRGRLVETVSLRPPRRGLAGRVAVHGPDHPGRVADDHGVGRHVLGDDRAGSDHRAVRRR